MADRQGMLTGYAFSDAACGVSVGGRAAVRRGGLWHLGARGASRVDVDDSGHDDLVGGVTDDIEHDRSAYVCADPHDGHADNRGAGRAGLGGSAG